MKRHVTVFPDTNSLLHYPPLKDVDWCHVFGAAEVTLAFCMQVIHELDEKKSDPRLASRAERAIKEIKGILAASGVVREKVTLEIFNHQLRSNEFPASLSPDSKDDRIVHLIKKYCGSHRDEPVCVYTEDFGMSLRCQAHGIDVIEPDRSMRLASPQTEQDRKYKAAITELHASKSLSPELDIRILPVDDDEIGEQRPLVRVYRKPQLEEVDAAVAQERAARALPAPPIAALSAVQAFDLNSVTPDEHRKYGEELERYLRSYREWAEAMNEFKSKLGPLFRFTIEVCNAGRSPADDVEATLELPPRLQFIAVDDERTGRMLDAAPTKPTPPKKPQTRLEQMKSSLAYAGDPRTLPRGIDVAKIKLRNQPTVHLSGSMDGGFAILFSIPKLIHHKTAAFGPFYSMFRTQDDATPFEIDLIITASNIPQKIERRIPFVVD